MSFVKSFLRLSSPNYCCRHIYDVVSNLMKYESVDAVVLYDYYKSNRYHDSTCCCGIVWSKDDFISDGSTFSLRWMYIWTTRVALIRKVGFWNYSCAFACRILTFTAYLNALPLGVAIAQRKLILDIDKYVFNPYVLSLC